MSRIMEVTFRVPEENMGGVIADITPRILGITGIGVIKIADGRTKEMKGFGMRGLTAESNEITDSHIDQLQAGILAILKRGRKRRGTIAKMLDTFSSQDVFKAMQQLHAAGKIKPIGISKTWGLGK